MINLKDDYIKIQTKKINMSQEFDDSAKVIPFTTLLLVDLDSVELFKNLDINSKLNISGTSKGKGFAGVVKKWNFRAGGNTHGRIKIRAGGSIGAQGDGRVIPGKKMAGRMGGRKISIQTNFLGVTKDNSIKIKGAVPGSKNSIVTVFIPNNQNV